jgi:hypothetical protein
MTMPATARGFIPVTAAATGALRGAVGRPPGWVRLVLLRRAARAPRGELPETLRTQD